MMLQAQHTPGTRQRGMTLVELMIAVLISIFLTGGILHIFTGSKSTYNVLAGISEIQEGGRISIERMKQKIRMTGSMGCSNLGTIDPNPVATAPGSSPFNASSTLTTAATRSAIFGVDSITGVSGGVVDTSDTLTIVTTTSADTTLSANMATPGSDIITLQNPSNFSAGEILVITDCENADVFAASTVTGTGNPPIGPYTITHNATGNNGGGDLSRAYLSDALLMRMQSIMFSVEDTTRTDNAGNAVFALFETIGGTRNEIITGVEDMQITYGVASTAGGPASGTYMTAAQVTASPAQWQRVVSVRLSLLISSVDSIGSQPRPYLPLDGTAAVAPDNRIRRTFTTTIGLRNRTS